MGETARHSPQASLEQVQVLREMSRSTSAQKATRISPSAMLEVMSALDEYWKELEVSDLGERSKSLYLGQADNFVRWMRGEFTPGSRNAPYGPRKSNAGPLKTNTW
jgi:hypothetical protein